MRRLGRPIIVDNFDGGHDDYSDSIAMPRNKMRLLENFLCNRESMDTRPGYASRIAAASLQADGIQRIWPFQDNTQARREIILVNGKCYSYDGTTVTDITGTVTLSGDQDARISCANYDGKMIASDGVNPLVYMSAADASLTTLTAAVGADRNLPTQVGTVVNYLNYLLLFNIVDREGTYPYRVRWQDPSAASKGALSTWPTRNHRDFNRGETVMSAAVHGGAVIVWQDFSTHYGAFDPAADSPFRWELLDESVGLVAKLGKCATRAGTFFAGYEGLYWIAPMRKEERVPLKPQYIGTPLEGFWKNVNKGALSGICCAEIPELNGVLFCVPYGANQGTNNRGIFLQYDSWSKTGSTTHPAYAIWSGVDNQPFAFSSLATATISGRRRLVMGDYSGNVWMLGDQDTMTTDNGERIRPIFHTPDYGVPDIESMWIELLMISDHSSEKQWSITQFVFGDEEPSEQVLVSGEDEVVLDEFELDVDFLAGDTTGRSTADLEGVSLYTRLHCELLDGLPASIHSLTLRRKNGSPL